jgi:GTP:adenosylcobinamide-phosphate guanylyltransferase
MRMPVEMFSVRWDSKVPDMRDQSNDIALLVLSADIISVDDEFLNNLITVNSSCS